MIQTLILRACVSVKVEVWQVAQRGAEALLRGRYNLSNTRCPGAHYRVIAPAREEENQRQVSSIVEHV